MIQVGYSCRSLTDDLGLYNPTSLRVHLTMGRGQIGSDAELSVCGVGKCHACAPLYAYLMKELRGTLPPPRKRMWYTHNPMSSHEYKKRGVGGACPGCFVNLGTHPDTDSPGYEKLCRRCLPGWSPRKRPNENALSESRVGTFGSYDAGEFRLRNSREYNKRKRSALGLLTLDDFLVRQSSTVPTCTANLGANDSMSSDTEDSKGSRGGFDVADLPEPPEDPVECQYKKRLGRVAQRCVDLLKVDRDMYPIGKLPKLIECGNLRSVIRSVYAKSLSVSDELSIKTSQKLELDACEFCKPTFLGKVREWKERVGRPRPVDDDHLKSFRRFFSMNVPHGWNKRCRETAFVPNGHGALGKLHTRKNGGNWNRECFSDACRIELVFSSGKPRVVTLFSSYNQEVLRPLHRSLFACLGKYNWLLQGPPTEERIAELRGGDYHSFDFASATDSLGSRYVGAMIDELVKKGVGLSGDQERCMRVLEKQFLGDGWTESGQPMGSLMSFPLLCLVNKTLMDMALADSLGIQRNRISKEALETYTTHPCLINGDDALVRDPPKQKKPFRQCFIWHGSKIGLVVNEEKSMRSSSLAEINSTVFRNGKEEKKTNLKVLGVGKEDVGDVVRMVRDSVTSRGGLVFGLNACSNALALQADKKIPLHRDIVGIIKSSKKVRHAISRRPVSVIEKENNLFPVCPKPDGYDLFPSQEKSIIEREVVRVRPLRECGTHYNMDLFLQRKRIVKQKRKALMGVWASVNRACKQKGRATEETILLCLARAWIDEKKDLSDSRWFSPACPFPARVENETRSTIQRLIDMIRCHDIA